MAEEFDDEGFVAGSFDPVKIYDAPMVALTQVFDGEASFRSLRDTVMNPTALSPAERDSFSSRLKESLGNNPAVNSIVDVALNPFVWFLFVTSPSAGAALKSGGRVFRGLSQPAVSQGKRYLEFLTGKYSFLEPLGVLNAHQYTAGTPINSILHSASTRLSELTEIDLQTMQPLRSEILERISAKFGTTVRSLDPNQAPVATATINGQAMSVKEYLEKFNQYAYIEMAGLNRTVTRKEGIIGQNVRLLFKDKGNTFQDLILSPSQTEVMSKKNASYIAQLQQGEAARQAGDFAAATNHFKTAKKILEDRVTYLNNIFGKDKIEDMGVTWQTRLEMSPTRADKLPYVPGDSPLKVFVDARTQESLDPEGFVKSWLQQEGFMPYLDQARDSMKRRYVDLFGKRDLYDATGVLEYDDGKLLRIFRSLSSSKSASTSAEISNVLNKELVGYVGEEGYDKILQAMIPDKDGKVKMTFDQFKSLLREVRSTSDDMDNFMSRNVWSYVEHGADGTPVFTRTDSIRVAPSLREARLSGRVQQRNTRSPIISHKDLQILHDEYELSGKVNPELTDQITRSELYVQQLPTSAEGGRGQVMNLDFEKSFDRYMSATRNDVVLHIDNAVDDEFIRAASQTEEWAQMLREGKPSSIRQREKRILNATGEIGNSRYQMLEFASDAMANNLARSGRRGGERAREYVMGTLIDRMRGAMPMRDLISEHATLAAMDMADSIANSKLMQEVKGMGGAASRFVQKLEDFGAMTLDEVGGSRLGRIGTSALYTSHLGFNLASAALNLMQPLMYATTWMGPKAMVKAYGNALKQYFGYIQERLALGLHADPLKVDALRAKHFRLSNVATAQRPRGVDLLDIRATDYELMDQQAFAAQSMMAKTGKGKLNFWLTEMPMKLFTHTEIFNRTVTGEAMLEVLRESGRIKGLDNGAGGVYNVLRGSSKFGDVEVVENVREMVQNTQFGSDLMNSPKVFQNSFLGIPWVRQFFTFPTRTITAWTDTAPMVDQGRRTWGLTGFKTQGRYSAMGHDMMRMMGTSAVVYEIGKNALGLDLSRGLTGQTMYDSSLIAPLMFADPAEVGYHLPLSPTLSMLLRDIPQALTSDDVSMLGVFAPRFLPGGIALSRALNAAPRLTSKDSWLGGIQKEYADWSNINPDGGVPIYRQDGSLLEYRSAPRTILGSLGFNSYMFSTDKELNSFLVQNRQAVVDERRKYVDAVLSNDMGKAARIQNDFKKRFKIPLSVTKEQMDRAIELREVPLKERMYQRISADFRPVVKPYLAERLEQLKSRTPEELDLSTAQKARTLPSTFETFDPYSVVTD